MKTYGGRAGRTRRPLERIYRIHELIQRKRFPNCRTMALKIEVTPKTIQRDISFMRDELDLPLAYDDVRHGYFYERPVQDFPFLKTTAEDIVALFLARRALEPLDGTPLEAGLRESFRRMTRSLSGHFTFPWSDLEEAFSVRSAGKAKADAATVEKLANAVLESRELRFEYQKLGAKGREQRSLRPFHLADIDGGWYVIGFDPVRKAKRTFAVQRIKGLRVLKTKFARPPDFKLEDHLGGSFGVWRNPSASPDGEARRTTVRIRFTGWAARAVSERRWHPSQEVKVIGGRESRVVMSLELDTFEDVTRWILSWGAQAEVLEPESLRKAIGDEVDQIRELYQG